MSLSGFPSAAAASVATSDVFWRSAAVPDQDPTFDLFSSDEENCDGTYTLPKLTAIDY